MFELTEEQRLLRESVRRLAREKIAPRAAEMDASQEFPDDIHRLFIEQGLLKLKIPGVWRGTCRRRDMLPRNRGDRPCGRLVQPAAGESPGRTGPSYDRIDGRPEVSLPAQHRGGGAHRRVRPDRTGGRVGYGLTQDKGNQRRQRIPPNRDQVLHHQRGAAKVFVLFATLDPALEKQGITAFLVEEKTGGSSGKKEDKMGMRASPTTELILEDAFVPEEERIGARERAGRFCSAAFRRPVSLSRPCPWAWRTGDRSGGPLRRGEHPVRKGVATFQGIQFMLADMLMGIETARSLVYRAARMQDQGHPLIHRYASMAKCYASDMAMRVTTDAVQMMGGYRYMKDYPVERMIRDAKVLQIFEGTNRIQRIIIARDDLASI